ncbi:hypothetical protein CRE_25846 [Caenorhabditis remanei]|uniref:Uncharacterized protein n=1 Tax=Caenorhabditis remanei TaxID=31234 RepID=E3NAA6_CAERE|nr:hypothetical protein CRE_25846 [Caenorhabditis remanei]
MPSTAIPLFRVLASNAPAIAGAANAIFNGPFNAKTVYQLVANVCPTSVGADEKCAKKPSELLGECETKKLAPNCEEVVRQGVEQFCTTEKTSPACAWLPTTTTATAAANITTESSNMLFMIIGAVVGVVLIIAIAIGLFFYCRKKKGGQGSGTTTGGTTGGTTQQSGMSTTTSGRSKKSTIV